MNTLSYVDIYCLCKQIVDMLPSNSADAKTCLSMMIDMYAKGHDMRSSELWKELYEIAMYVHDVIGDYK